jgi:putative ABC transport system permease protein
MSAIGLPAADLVGVASLGIRTRRVRAALSGLGIAIGVAAVVGVLGISQASEADLLARIGQLSNLLQVAPGPGFGAQAPELPATAPGMISRMDDVRGVTATALLQGRAVQRTDRESALLTRGITVAAVQTGLLGMLEGSVQAGTFLNAASERYPAMVLGAIAAQRLGIDRTGVRVWMGRHWFTVVGILVQFPSQPDLDRSALIGFPAAASLFEYDGAPTTIYVRTRPDRVDQVGGLLAATVAPDAPQNVQVVRPADALAARAAASTAFTQLFLALGAVSLLVSGVMVANVMLTSVLERRREIGLRRALGATKLDISIQFLAEAVLLSGLGGLAGVAIGMLITAAYTQLQGLPFAVPPGAVAGGLGAAAVTGAVAGLYPALRAARLAPTEALGST